MLVGVIYALEEELVFYNQDNDKEMGDDEEGR